MRRMIVSADIAYAPYDSECGHSLCTRMIVSADIPYASYDSECGYCLCTV